MIGTQPYGTDRGATSGTGITSITSVDGSVTVSNPTGPVVDLSVNPGTLDPVLEMWTPPGASSANVVDFGLFAPASTSLGSCFWQGWVRVTGPGYVWKGVDGGSHSILVGLLANSLDATKLQVSGNFFDGTSNVSFASQDCDFIGVGEWIHLAVGVELGTYNRIWAWVDGILCAKGQAISARVSPGGGGGIASLFLGGGSHQGAEFRAAWLQGWDTNVFPFVVNDAWDAFIPSFTGEESRVGQNGVGTSYPDLWADCVSSDGLTVPDRSFNQIPPLTGTRFRTTPQHVGLLRSILDAPYGDGNQGANQKPRVVRDPTFPGYMAGPRVIANAYLGVTQPVPTDGKTYVLWADFSGADSNMVTTQGAAAPPTLPTVTLGSAAPKSWQVLGLDGSGRFRGWGRKYGCAIPLGTSNNTAASGVLTAPAWIDSTIAIGGVQFKRPTGEIAGSDVFQFGGCLIYRMTDGSNMWVAEVFNDNVTLSKWVAGAQTVVVGSTAMGAWDTLRVTFDGSNVHRVYSGTGGVYTLVATTGADAFNSAGTLVGMTRQFGSLCRFQNFGCFSNP